MTFKLKVGRRPLALDVEACRVLREGLGDDVELYLDANRGWTANEALEVLRRTEGLGLTMLEEPCDAKEALSRRRLVEKSPIPVVMNPSQRRETCPGSCSLAAAMPFASRLPGQASQKPPKSWACAPDLVWM